MLTRPNERRKKFYMSVAYQTVMLVKTLAVNDTILTSENVFIVIIKK